MHVLSILSLASLALASPTTNELDTAAPIAGGRDAPATLLRPRDAATVLPGRYIIKMREEADVSAAAAFYNTLYIYGLAGLKGFAAPLNEDELNEIRNNPDVEYVEEDQVIDMHEYISQEDAPWALSRISHRSNGFSNYVYDDSAGEGTCVYIIDTGINVDHEEFEGRAEWLMNFSGDGNDNDGAGHGTYVAGLVASRTYGVAKQARVFALKVFRDDGTTDSSSIIAAMDYVVQDSSSGTRNCPAGYVANLSLGGGFSQASNDAADAMVNAGVFVAVSAGNSDVDAAQTSPASAPLACTVGATDANDTRASFSNYGAVVDIWAPGVDLESTSNEGGSTVESGTSASSPVVAGLGAYLMAFEGIPGGEAVCNRIIELSTRDILSDIPAGTVNQLAYNGAPEDI